MTINGVHISDGNTKTGKIPAFSLAPGMTCSAAACRTCYNEGCYARKLYRLRPTVKKAWDENTDFVLHDLERVENALDKYLTKHAPRFFRVHVSGDFVTREYAAAWARIASKHTETRFLAFTKQFDIIRGIEFPGNFSIVASAWEGVKIPNDIRAAFPVAWVFNTIDDIPENIFECPGRCDTCGACWGLAKKGIDVGFLKH
jgi:hypothetical protein